MLSVILCVAACVALAETDDFVALPTKAVLRCGERELSATTTIVGLARPVADACVVHDGATIRIYRAGTLASEVQSPDGSELVWLGSFRDEAYFTKAGVDHAPTAVSSEHVRRLDARKGVWLPALSLTRDGKPFGADVMEVASVEGFTAVLADAGPTRSVSLYRRAPGVPHLELAWQTSFPSELADAPEDPAVLLASRYPDRASASPSALLFTKETLIVCSNAQGPVRGLALNDGSIRWTIERPWELRRGFIGPSVWSHEIARFGDSMLDFDDASRSAARAKFDATYFGTILAGPATTIGAARVFLSVGLGPRDGWTHHLMEPSILEFDVEGGRPISIAPLPRRPLGSRWQSHGDAAVWMTQGDSLLCVGESHDEQHGMGPGGFDCVSDIRWIISSPHADHEFAWVSAPGIDGVAAFWGDSIVRASEGMYVQRSGDRVVVLPLTRTRFGNATVERWTLEVPFDGVVKPPMVNSTLSWSASGTLLSCRVDGPFLISVTGLAVDGDRLLVTLGEEERVHTLEFDVRPLVGSTP